MKIWSWFCFYLKLNIRTYFSVSFQKNFALWRCKQRESGFLCQSAVCFISQVAQFTVRCQQGKQMGQQMHCRACQSNIQWWRETLSARSISQSEISRILHEHMVLWGRIKGHILVVFCMLILMVVMWDPCDVLTEEELMFICCNYIQEWCFE